MTKSRWFDLTSISLMIILAAASRLIPHPPNMTPVIGMTLFGAVLIQEKRLALLIPFLATLLSDAVIGFDSVSSWAVYLALFITFVFGRTFAYNPGGSKNLSLPLLGTTLASSTVFFILTNFAVWLNGSLYAKDLSGLALCYTAALPFFRNSLIGDLGSVLVLFGLYSVIQSYAKPLASRA